MNIDEPPWIETSAYLLGCAPLAMLQPLLAGDDCSPTDAFLPPHVWQLGRSSGVGIDRVLSSIGLYPSVTFVLWPSGVGLLWDRTMVRPRPTIWNTWTLRGRFRISICVDNCAVGPYGSIHIIELAVEQSILNRHRTLINFNFVTTVPRSI